MTVGEKINLLIAERRRRYSQKKLAKAVGVSEGSISAYVNDEYFPPLDVAFRIAREFGVSLDWLADKAKDYPPTRIAADDAPDLTRPYLVAERARKGAG